MCLEAFLRERDRRVKKTPPNYKERQAQNRRLEKARAVFAVVTFGYIPPPTSCDNSERAWRGVEIKKDDG